MYTIVGLRNPQEVYEHTRHNAGAIVVSHFAHEIGFPTFVSSEKYNSEISEGILGGKDVRIVLPRTFMNTNGGAVRRILADTPDHEDLIVVHDELDLPIGTFSIAQGRGSGGHNGVQSVIDKTGSRDFIRVRVGISPVSLFGTMKRPTGEKVADFVLHDFSVRERTKIDALLPTVSAALEMIVREGVTAAMNTYNKK